VHLSLAEKSGAVLHAQTTATIVEVGPDRRLSAIRFKRWDGSEGVASGRVFVLAAHGIEIPRLLLNSRSEATPKGVANSSDQIGRNLMDHPVQLSWALAPQPVWPYRGPLSTSGIENLRDAPFRKDRPAFRIELGNDGWSWPKSAPTTTAADLARLGLRHDALNSALRDQASRHLRLTSLLEQLPEPDNRATLDPTAADMYGVPQPRIAYRLGPYIEAGLTAARDAHSKIFAAMGATEIQHRDAAEGAGHIMGTGRMGNDPKDSVVDRDLRSHDHPNLFILGSAVFPTGATANPTLTIAALSLRAVDQVKAVLTR
jgi:choline dehydrogenase-like flavoprotein